MERLNDKKVLLLRCKYKSSSKSRVDQEWDGEKERYADPNLPWEREREKIKLWLEWKERESRALIKFRKIIKDDVLITLNPVQSCKG
jgi:hypothetical protein